MPLALTTVFAALPDPRRDTRNKLHRLTDILTIATCAVIAGADGWDQVAEYARRKEAFFRRFLAPSEDGLLLGARSEGRLVGYACLYWHFSSLEAVESVLMNDLYVSEEARGVGVGRALIEATAVVAREREVPFVEWSTAPDNKTAQRLYDSTGAERTEWFSYELRA